MFVPPKIFISDHFPDRAADQLLDDPVEYSQFVSMPQITSAVYDYGVELPNTLRMTSIAADTAVLELEAPAHVNIQSFIADFDENNYINRTHTVREGDHIRVIAAPPNAGMWRLRFIVQPEGPEESLLAAEIALRSSGGVSVTSPAYYHGISWPNDLSAPRSVGAYHTVSIDAPEALELWGGLIDENERQIDNRVYVERQGEVAEFHVTTPESGNWKLR